MRTVLAAVPLLFLLSALACSKNNPVDDDAENAAGLDQVVAAANATAEAVREQTENAPPPAPGTNATAPIPAQPNPGALIPAQYQGRWGLVPGDCTSTRGDAKGLMTVGDTSIRFYGSTATLTAQRPAKASSFSGLFAFRGEGQSWEKVMTFTRTGARLERADPEGRFTYSRCT